MKKLIVILIMLSLFIVPIASMSITNEEFGYQAMEDIGIHGYKIVKIDILDFDTTLRITATSPNGKVVFLKIRRNKGLFSPCPWRLIDLKELPK